MHETVVLPCIFGCIECIDDFRHYLIWFILWQLAREALDIRETSCAVGHRLCLYGVNLDNLSCLGFIIHCTILSVKIMIVLTIMAQFVPVKLCKDVQAAHSEL